MEIIPLGDQAVLVHAPDEESAGRLAAAIRSAPPAWLVDLVLSYSSVALHFDRRAVRSADAIAWTQAVKVGRTKLAVGRRFEIPCCYDMGPDLEAVARQCKINPDEVAAAHAGTEYRVYAVGFAPGFPYMGYLPESLCGVPRLPSPRMRVEPGSVGLTGRQTGIYPLLRPGGWPLIGRTPLRLVDLEQGFFALTPGDRVRFVAIDPSEYKQRDGERLLPVDGK
ncbi:MAG: carboxyltransferase domain-containing protein [Gemmataceae bacterium]|nr:carboxyltransferase domain-containing protein [Gemmataceae bacterium]